MESRSTVASEITVGDVVTYHPDPHHRLGGRTTFYVQRIATHPDGAPRRRLWGASLPGGTSWPGLFRDEVADTHPVTIARPQWAVTRGRMLVHVIDPDASSTVTRCGVEGAQPIPGAEMARHGVCRACGYRTIRAAEALYLTRPYTTPGTP